MKYFGRSKSLPYPGFLTGLVFQQVMTVLSGVTVPVGWLCFPSLLCTTLKRYWRGLQKPLLLWDSCSDCLPMQHWSLRICWQRKCRRLTFVGFVSVFQGSMPLGKQPYDSRPEGWHTCEHMSLPPAVTHMQTYGTALLVHISCQQTQEGPCPGYVFYHPYGFLLLLIADKLQLLPKTLSNNSLCLFQI